MKRNTRWTNLLLVALLAGLCLPAARAADIPLRLLREAGAVVFAQNDDYGRGIQSMFLGYDEEGKPVAGVASRETPTYQRALTYIAVAKTDDGYIIRSVEIPELATFHGKSQDYAREALEDIAGRELSDATQARGLVDAVTGATQYRQAIYVSSSLMATRIIHEIEADSQNWERQPLP